MSVVVVVIGTKIARSRALGICARYKHNQSVDIWFICASNCSKRLTSAINRAFSVQHACGLSTTPTLLGCADATAHAQAQYWKGSSRHKTPRVLQYYATVATERMGYVLYRALVFCCIRGCKNCS